MIRNFQEYNSVLFDFDGVIANSNDLKMNAFIEVIEENFKMEKQEIEQFLHSQQGHNRHHIFTELMLNNKAKHEIVVSDLINKFSKSIRSKLLDVEYCKTLSNLNRVNPSAFWGVITAGDSDEVGEFLSLRTDYKFFYKNIFDGKMPKSFHVRKLIQHKILRYPMLYFGDSLADYHLARDFHLDFVYISKWRQDKIEHPRGDYPYLHYSTLADFVTDHMG